MIPIGGIVLFFYIFQHNSVSRISPGDPVSAVDLFPLQPIGRSALTGNGRSGALYAYMNFDIQPDIVSTAKGIGGGLPLAACLMGEKVEKVLGFGDHGSTFGGNPVACAGALTILSRIDDKLLAEVRRKSEYIFKAFEGADGVESVSGMGLMIGIKPAGPAGKIVQAAIGKGVLALTAKDRIRLLPALNIPQDLLEKAVCILKKLCAEIQE